MAGKHAATRMGFTRELKAKDLILTKAAEAAAKLAKQAAKRKARP